jgi:hypothetical protein
MRRPHGAATVLAVLGLASVFVLPSGLRAAEHFPVVADPFIHADALYVFPGRMPARGKRAAGDKRIHQAHILRGCVVN